MDTTKIIATYDEAAEEYARNRQGHEPKEELAKFFKLLKPGARILDVGCAAGRDTRYIKDHDFEVVGVDLSQKLLDIGKKTHPDIEFVLADMRELPFEDASFDGVWANAVMHHLDEAEMPAALAEFARLVPSGGVVCVRTKMGEGRLKTRDIIVEGGEREFSLLSKEKLDQLLTAQGLTKISLNVSESKSREGLLWLTAFYKKDGKPDKS